MKKLIKLILSVAFVLVLIGCSQKDDLQQGDNKTQYFFSGKVIEVAEEYLLIEVNDTGNSNISDGAKVEVSTKVVSADGCPAFVVDEYARVLMARNTGDNPSGRLEALSIYKTDKEGNVMNPTDNNMTSETEQTQQEQIENDNTAYPPSVMVDDIVYKDTGYISSMLGCGNMDGEITSEVDGTKLPTENNQSNFGIGYQYQIGSKGHINVVIDGEKRIFRDINSDDTSIPVEVKNFTAEVKEIDKNGELLVTHISTAEGFVEMSDGDYYVSTENLKDEVNVGDTVRIWFNGSVQETAPAQLGMVYRIEKSGN